MDDEIIYFWCFNHIKCFDSTPSTAIIIFVKNLESLLSLRSQKLVLLGSRDTILGKNSNRGNFLKIWMDKEMKYGMKKIIIRFIFIFYEK